MGLDPDKTYRAAAVALDLKTGGFGGEFFLSDVYPEESAGELSIELVYDKYFDGDQAAALGGEYASFAGKALVPVSVRVNGAGSYRWAVTTYPEDYTSASDKSFWSTLSWEEIFYEDEPAANIALDWDVDYTLVAMVRNDAGDAYKRFVQEVRFTKQGASPIGELTPLGTAGAPLRRAADRLPPAGRRRPCGRPLRGGPPCGVEGAGPSDGAAVPLRRPSLRTDRRPEIVRKKSVSRTGSPPSAAVAGSAPGCRERSRSLSGLRPVPGFRRPPPVARHPSPVARRLLPVVRPPPAMGFPSGVSAAIRRPGRPPEGAAPQVQ